MNPSCGEFYWHNAETPLSDIPFDVQLNFTLRASSVEAPDNSGLSCPQCRTRRANKGCQRSPPHCSTCCKAAGGCRIHKVTSGNQPSSLMGPPNEGKLTLFCILNRRRRFNSSSQKQQPVYMLQTRSHLHRYLTFPFVHHMLVLWMKNMGKCIWTCIVDCRNRRETSRCNAKLQLR